MKQLRYAAASLMVITGVLHTIPMFKGIEDPNALPMLAFGIGYLAIGVLLYLNKQIGKITGIILPLIGLGIGFIKIGIENWDTMFSVMFLIDALVAISCIILLLNKLPKDYNDSDKSYPVIYRLDGDFDLFIETVKTCRR